MTTSTPDPRHEAAQSVDAPGDEDLDAPSAAADAPAFRLGYVPGATPAKWARIWRQRLPREPLGLVQVEADDVHRALADGEIDAALARLPVDRDVMHAIALYEEVAVVVASRDHAVAALDETETVTLADLDDEVVQHPLDDVLWRDRARPGREPYERAATTKEAVAVVAAGVGVLVVPKSLARLHSRKDVVAREVSDGPLAPVGLVWLRDSEHDLVDEMVGIVRGRTANSSRGRVSESAERPEPPAAKKVTGKSTSRGQSRQGSRTGGRSAAAKRAAQGKRSRRQGR